MFLIHINYFSLGRISIKRKGNCLRLGRGGVTKGWTFFTFLHDLDHVAPPQVGKFPLFPLLVLFKTTFLSWSDVLIKWVGVNASLIQHEGMVIIFHEKENTVENMKSKKYLNINQISQVWFPSINKVTSSF